MAPPPPVQIEWASPAHHGPPSRLHGWSKKVAGILTFDKRLRYRGQSEMDAARFQQEHYRRNGWWPFQRQYPGAMPPMHQQYASAPAALGTPVVAADPYAYGQGRRRWWPFARRRYPTEHHHHHEHEHEHGSHHDGHGSHHGHDSHHGHGSHHARPTYVTDGGHTEVYDAPGVRVEVHRGGGRKLSRAQSHPHRLQRSHSRRREPEYYDARLQRYRTVHPDFSARYRRHWGHPDHRCVPQYFGLWCLIKGYLTGNDALKHRGRMERDYAKRERRKERRRRWALFKAEMWARRHGHRTPFTL